MQLDPQPPGLSLLARFRGRVVVTSGLGSQPSESLRGRVRRTWRTERVFLRKVVATELADCRVLRGLAHPHLERIFGTCSADNQLFVVIADDGQIHVANYVKVRCTTSRRRIAAEVADGLAFLHKSDIVHGDLNIIHVSASPVGHVILGGFGRPRVDDVVASSRTELGPWTKPRLGEYAPYTPNSSDASLDNLKWRDWRTGLPFEPEEPADVDAAENLRAHLQSHTINEDVYAFGFIALAIFTDLRPIPSADSLLTIRRLANSLPPQRPREFELRGCDDAAWDLLLRCWRQPPTAAAASARELADAFASVTDRLVLSPIDWDHDTIMNFVKPRVPRVFAQIQNIEQISADRDIEQREPEVRGYWKQERLVVVKLLDVRSHRRQFTQSRDMAVEMCVWSQLQHRNIVPLLGVYDDPRAQVDKFIMPWMGGGTMKDYLKAHPEADRLNLVLGVAQGLAYLHSRSPSLIHGDVRTHNVWFQDDNIPLLANFDFGPVGIVDTSFDASEAGGQRIRPRYRQPEPLTTVQSDVFQFALLIYEVFARSKPFPELSPDKALQYYRETRRPERPTSGFTDDLWHLVERSWRAAPPRRPSMPRVLRTLEQFVTS